MTTERHYTEEEVAAIFEQAIEAQESARKSVTSREGLTLAELQEIGADLGITPEFIAAAAAASEVKTTKDETKKSFGLPVRVQRTIELPRAPSDEEWDRLVVDLRETFQARGSIKQNGSLRQWTNGNLQALVEPSGDGYRLRMRSFLSNSRDAAWSAGAALVTGIAMILTLSANSSVEGPAFIIPGMLLLLSVLLFARNRYRVPRWHKERSDQMEGIGKRLAATMTESAGSDVFEISGQQSGVTTQQPTAPRLDLDDVPDSEVEESRDHHSQRQRQR